RAVLGSIGSGGIWFVCGTLDVHAADGCDGYSVGDGDGWRGWAGGAERQGGERKREPADYADGCEPGARGVDCQCSELPGGGSVGDVDDLAGCDAGCFGRGGCCCGVDGRFGRDPEQRNDDD